ncbi:MAG: nucleoside-diphosphate sugar epimerase/dehydratase [Oscillospiraceae bacterium]|nr:nucleoside-diphosphate sugar epimerase/dehydratase [Oscillospiraceae bacterium]
MKEATTNFLRRYRRGVLIAFDIFCITVAYLVTWVLISGRTSVYEYRSLLFSSCVLFVLCFVIVYVLMGMYDSLWRYAEIYEFFRCALASVLAIAAFLVITLVIYNERRIPISVYFMSAMFAASLTLYTRLTYRMFRNTQITNAGKQRKRVMVVGAGDAASTLLHEIFRDENTDYNIVCAVDDNPQKLGRTIMGIKIMGTTRDIPSLVAQCDIDTILLAVPAADDAEKRRILNICSKTSCNMRMLPDICKLISDGKDLLSRVRDVKVEDLLGRDEIDLDEVETFDHIRGKVVLVTGAGGSIGSELCEQIAASGPKKLILVDIYENSAYNEQQKLLREYGAALDLEVCIASVRDSRKMDALFESERPQLVFHAAAHKHVPLMETSPEEAVKNNVCGTWNVARSADKYGVETFVLISTDKAVNPTSIMGATKRICEMIVQAMAKTSATRFVAVRFGNVLGSNGSVIPLFKEQIAAGGPVTVTHPDIVRYFMTIREAVSLVIASAEIAKGGEIFVLDMGHQVKILDLAENLIRLAGFTPYKDIPIVFTGLRPGEKLYEELLLSEEGITKTDQKKIFIGNPGEIDKDEFFERLAALKATAYDNKREQTVRMVIDMVPTFRHDALAARNEEVML